MKIPALIKVGGHLIAVDCSRELQDKDGEWDPTTNTIHICSSLAQSQREATFFHELFHIINSELGNDPIMHALMESLSQQFYQVFHDNELLK